MQLLQTLTVQIDRATIRDDIASPAHITGIFSIG